VLISQHVFLVGINGIKTAQQITALDFTPLHSVKPCEFSRWSNYQMEKMNTEYQILFLVCLVCHIFRSLYEILKYKKILSPGNKIVFSLVFVNMCLLWASWFMMCEVDPVKLTLPFSVRIVGLVFFVTGIFLFAYTVFRLRTLDDFHGQLVQDGLFSITRHPMYLGFIFWLVGYSVFQQSKYTLLTSIIWILNIWFWRYIEEKQLDRKYPNFGEYKKKTIF
jgi:protein-S-isoprenylcysteine O-methyltransferase Ste14